MKIQIICEPMPAWQWDGSNDLVLSELREWLKEDDLIVHGIFAGHLSITISGLFMRIYPGDLLVETFKTIWPTSIRHFSVSAIGKLIKIIKED